MLLIITTLTFYPLTTSSSDASALTGTATPATTSLALTTGHTTADVEVTPFEFSGAFAASSSADEASFSVTTNNNTGYTLSIKASDDTGKLTNTSDSSLYLDSIESNVSESSFDTATYNNKWGYKPSKYKSGDTIVTNNSSDPIFLPSPTTSSTILDETSTANTTANTYTIGLGIRADYNTIAGTYSKSFTLLATANPSVYTINYDKNTEGTVSGMPTSAENVFTDSTTITLSSSTPTWDGHNFGGWCSVQTSDDSCPGTTYQPGATYGIDQTAANVVTLYAMWESDLPATAIQDITISTCPTTPTKVYDTRDNEVYTIQKLNDGRCWLLDNLRLDLSTTGTLESSTTNIDSNWSVPADIASKINTTSKNEVASYGSGSSKKGIQYDYCAATAGTYCTNSISNANFSHNQDICPKGWRMPTSGFYYNEFPMLHATYGGDTTNYNDALHIVYPNNANAFWSSSRKILSSSIQSLWSTYGIWETTAAYIFRTYLSSNSASPGSYDYSSYKNPVRCILDATTISELNTLQEFNDLTVSAKTSVLSSMVVGQTYQLKDSRDGEVYSIAKLADGKVWFLDNLRLDLVSMTENENLVQNLQGQTNASYGSLNTLANAYAASTEGFFAAQRVADWSTSYSFSNPLVHTVDDGNGNTIRYYNYCAASAGSYCYGNGTSAGTSVGNDFEDICPKGWRMPTGGSNGEYKALYTAYSSNATNFKNAFHATTDGYYYNGSLSGRNTAGYFWSSSRYSASGMYRLLANSSITPASYVNRSYGLSVRCVLDVTNISEITTMQEFSNSARRKNAVESMVEGQQYTLTDARDSKSYTIAKLPDGLVWMTTNLDIAGGTKLVPSTSNLYKSSYTLPASKDDLSSQFTSNSKAYVYNTNNTDCDAAPCYSYYSYAASTVGTNPSSDNAVQDICPRGWRIPDANEYDVIYDIYNSGPAIVNSPWRGVYSGLCSDSACSSNGEAGYYAEGTAYTSAHTGFLYYLKNAAGGAITGALTGATPKKYGLAVRCVLRP